VTIIFNARVSRLHSLRVDLNARHFGKSIQFSRRNLVEKVNAFQEMDCEVG